MSTETLETILTTYFRVNLAIRDEKTRKQYRHAITSFGRFLGHAPTLADLEDDNMAGLMGSMLNDGYAERTVNDRRNRIHCLWEWCAKRKLTDRWPTIKPVSEPYVEPRAWSKEELQRLVTTAATYSGTIEGIALADWWLGLLLVIWDTGSRTTETLSMRWEWLDFETGVMRVPASARKGRKKPATYWIKPATLDVLRNFARPNGVIFRTRAVDPSSFYQRWKLLLQKAGLATGRSEGPQKMRRSFATWLTAAGGDATEALFHSSAAITKKSYLDRSILESPQNARLFDLRAGG